MWRWKLAEDVPPPPNEPRSGHAEDTPRSDLDGMFDDLRTRLTAESESQGGVRGRLAGLATPWRKRAALAVALLVPMLALGSVRENIRDVLDVRHLLLALLAAGTAGSFGVVAVRGWHEPGVTTTRAATLLLGSLALLLLLFALPHGHELPPHGALASGMGIGAASMGCLAYGLTFAAPVYLAVRMLGHDSAYSRPFAAAAAALSGNLALLLHCPLEVRLHQVAGHGGVLVVAVLLGVALERRRTAG